MSNQFNPMSLSLVQNAITLAASSKAVVIKDPTSLSREDVQNIQKHYQKLAGSLDPQGPFPYPFGTLPYESLAGLFGTLNAYFDAIDLDKNGTLSTGVGSPSDNNNELAKLASRYEPITRESPWPLPLHPLHLDMRDFAGLIPRTSPSIFT